MRFVIFQVNTDLLMNHLKEYFYTRHPTRVLHLRKILLSIADVSRNIHILRQFYWFSLWVRCAIFQINTNLLISEQNINIFTQETLFSFFIFLLYFPSLFWKNDCDLYRKVILKNSFFTIFSLF